MTENRWSGKVGRAGVKRSKRWLGVGLGDCRLLERVHNIFEWTHSWFAMNFRAFKV